MVIIGGESNNTGDLNDLWALNLEAEIWIKPNIIGNDKFLPKRFHTSNTIRETQIITFGGCYGEYLHMNDLNVFELRDFILDQSLPIVCTKVAVKQNLPSTRWGHGAVVYQGTKLLILGGRNDNDVADIHCFDSDTM